MVAEARGWQSYLRSPLWFDRIITAEIYEQISRARVRLEDVSGSSVVGFRAPGYHLNGT